MATETFTNVTAQAWSWPTGVTSVNIECIGGGGGGGTASGNPATGGGGKGGQYAFATVAKGAESSLDITAPGTSGPGNGSAAFVSQSGTVVCRGLGGSGGAAASVNSTNGTGATTQNTVGGTIAGVGSVIRDGGNGGTGNFTSGVGGSGAGGGAAGSTSVGGAASGNTAGTAGGGDAGAGAVGVGGPIPKRTVSVGQSITRASYY
jgi:hypothetical protein